MNRDENIKIEAENRIIKVSKTTVIADCLEPLNQESLETKDSETVRGFSKSTVFGEVRVGDCLMYAGSKITIFNNGGTSWRAVTRSTDTNDLFEIQIYLLDANDRVLDVIPFGGGNTWGFNEMPNSNQDYPFIWDRWRYNEAVFDAARFARIICRC